MRLPILILARGWDSLGRVGTESDEGHASVGAPVAFRVIQHKLAVYRECVRPRGWIGVPVCNCYVAGTRMMGAPERRLLSESELPARGSWLKPEAAPTALRIICALSA